MKPTDKGQQSPSKSNAKQQEPPAGANSKRESDSHGDQGGDKAGGGAEGGGQKSPHDGTGSSGQNQSADNGGGKSTEKGKGEKSHSAGGDSKSDHETGAPGSEKGEGGKQQAGKGEKPGGDAADKSAQAQKNDNAARPTSENAPERERQPKAQQDSGDKGKRRQPDKENNQQTSSKSQDRQQNHGANNDQNAQKNGNGAAGGGQPGGAVNPQPSITGSAPPGDAANLEYARKQTDLVLDKLSDELKKNKVDKGLLKDLGWSREDLARFVERWQQRKDAAERDDAAGRAAKRELDDALRSLGLQRGQLQQSEVPKDSMRDCRKAIAGRCRSSIAIGCGRITRASRVRTMMSSKTAPLIVRLAAMGDAYDKHRLPRFVNAINCSIIADAVPKMSGKLSLKWLNVVMVPRIALQLFETASEFACEWPIRPAIELLGVFGQADLIHRP